MNQKGFVTFSLILFLPFILILSFGVLFNLWLINQKHNLENICHTHILKAQQHLVEGNKNLLSLNPYAQQLIIQKRMANIALAAAPPHLKPLARLQKQRIILQQKTLNFQQKAILHTANWQSKKSLFILKKKIHQKLVSLSDFWKAQNYKTPKLFVLWKSSQIKIKTKDIAPTYKRSLNQSRKQRLQLRWSFNLNSQLPGWLKKWVPVYGHWRGQCSSHPHKGGARWIAVIGEGKH